MRALIANTPGRREKLTTHGIIVAGVVLLLGAWLLTAVSIVAARQQALHHTEAEARNFATAFADEVAQTLNNVAGAMELVAQRMRAADGSFDIATWAHEVPLLSDAAIQAAIIGPDGRLVSTTLDSTLKSIDLSDREHFRIHLDGSFPGIFIGKPVAGRVSHQVTIQVTRRVNAADGTFLGVVLFSLAPGQLTSLHKTIDLGPRDVILLTGLDNIIRARFTRDQSDGLAGIGQSIAGGPRPDTFLENAGGFYSRKGVVDGVERVLGYRRVGKYPLVATVGRDLDEALAAFYRYAVMLVVFTGLATFVIVGLGLHLIREMRCRTASEIELSNAHARLAATNHDLEVDVVRRAELERRLRESEQRFRDIAEIGGDWVWETDSDHRFTLFSGSQERIRPTGETLETLIGKIRWEVAGGDPDRDAIWREYKANIDDRREFRQFRYSIATKSGGQQCISVNGRPVFDATGVFCGYRGTSTDETDQVEALRRAERAETMLRDAVESISQPFVIYGPDDRLEMCNAAYRGLYPENSAVFSPGVQFEEVLRNGLAHQQFADAIGREEEWLADRMEHHRNPTGPIETMFGNGRCWLVSESRMRNGGYAGLRIDVTRLKETEARLRQTMEDLDRVQRIAGIGSTAEDLATREYTWSPGACAIFGIESDGAGKTVEYMRQFYHPADRPRIIEAGERARRQGVPAPPLEYRIVRPDGAVRWVWRENDIQHDAAGRAIRRIVTFKDITDLKAKEMQLREAMDHLNRVQRIAGIGSIEVDLTGDEERIIWSASACELFGLAPNSVEPSPEFLLRLIHPDDRAKARKASDRANRTGTPAPPLEYRIVRPDGAERTMYRENAIQYDDTGDPARRIVTYKDITLIKATEAQLRQTQDDLNRAQRLAKVGSDAWDLRTGEVVWSDETYRIFGVGPEEFIATHENFLDLVLPEDRPGLVDCREAILRARCPAPTEFSIRRPDGEVRRIYSEGELIRDEKGKPTRWVGMRQDITEQARVERSLREAKEAAEAASVAKSQLLANTSHELRTPLNAIIGFSEMLGLGLAGTLRAEQKEYVGLIHQSGQHLLNVINDILDLAHADSGKLELHEEVGIDVHHVIDACVSLTRGRANSGDLRLTTEIEDRLPMLIADPTRLKQILLNLMSNAIKFTKPGGSVLVIGRRNREGGVSFGVRDTGAGMAPNEIEIALEPFGQVDASHTRQHQGTGLGLPIARRLAELHGGSLHISSEKGRGTTVTVTLPASRTVAGTPAGGVPVRAGAARRDRRALAPDRPASAKV